MTRTLRSLANRHVLLLALALTLAAGCTPRSSDDGIAKVSTWIPGAASRAATGGLDMLQNKAGTTGLNPVVGLATLIGEPRLNTRGTWFAWLAASHATIEQDLLVRTNDGRFFIAHFVWKDEPILVSCMESPGPCAKFEDAQALNVDDAKALLSHSSQFTPALYHRFFQTTSTSDARS